MFLDPPALRGEPHQCGHLTREEPCIDAHMHVMPCHTVDERVQQAAVEMRQPRPQRLAEDDQRETFAEPAQFAERITLEVMEKEIRDQDSATDGLRRLEDIPLVPLHTGRQPGGPGGQIQRAQGRQGERIRELPDERPVPRAQLRDAIRGGPGEAPHRAEDPAVIPHQPVDHPQITAAADRLRIPGGQMIEDLGNNDTAGHGGIMVSLARVSSIIFPMPQPPRRPFRDETGKQRPGPPRKPAPKGRPSAPQADQGWDPVAAWYDKLVGETGSDYHRNVILPATLRMLALRKGEQVVDVCCGQGVLVRPLLEEGAGKVLGVDASPRLIKAARERHGNDARVALITADACQPASWADGTYDAATCLMAVHDVPDILGLFTNVAKSLRPGGRAVLVFMHPCFRIPKKTHWGFDNDQKIQFRRLDSYGSPLEIQVTTHPGKGGPEQTVFHHRPLADLLSAIGRSGMAVTGCEELYSHRRSQGGGAFSKAEHKAAEEFPLFIALHCVVAAAPGK